MTTLPARIKVKQPVKYPANIRGKFPIKVEKSGADILLSVAPSSATTGGNIIRDTDAAYGVVADGVTDDSAEILLADAAAQALGGAFVAPFGVRRISSNITLNSTIIFYPGAMLKPDAGVTITLRGGYSAPDDYSQVFDISQGGKVIGVKQSGAVSVCHYGAKGIGKAHDDTDAIQAAINYASLLSIRTEYGNSHRVLFPLIASDDQLFTDISQSTDTNFYYITRRIVVNRNTIIEGVGDPARLLGATRLGVARSAKTAFFFQFPDAIPDVATTVTATNGSVTITVGDKTGLRVGMTATIDDVASGKIVSISTTTNNVTLDTPYAGATGSGKSGLFSSGAYEPGTQGSSGKTAMRRLFIFPTRDGAKTITSVNVTTNVFSTAPAVHNFQNGDAVFYTTNGDPASPLIAGSGASMHFYYVIRINDTDFKLAETPAKALAGTSIDVTGQGSGTQQVNLWGHVDFGIIANNTVHLEDIVLRGFGKAGLFLHGATTGTASGDESKANPYGDPQDTKGTMIGNVILSTIRRVTVMDCIGPGIATLGANAQPIEFTSCTSENNSCGFSDHGSGGAEFFGCHTQGNTFKIFNTSTPGYVVSGPNIASGTSGQSLSLTPGATYLVNITLSGTPANFRPTFTGGTQVNGDYINGAGSWQWIMVAGASSNAIAFEGTGTVTSLTVRRVNIGASPELASGTTAQSLSLVSGQTYRVEITLSAVDAVGGFAPKFTGGTAVSGRTYKTTGTHRWIMTAGASSNAIDFTGTGYTITSLSVKACTCYIPYIAHTSSDADEPGVGANWRRYWGDVRATTAHRWWSSGDLFIKAGGYNTKDDVSSCSTFYGCYSEGGIEDGAFIFGNNTVIGGVLGSIAGRVVYHPRMGQAQVVGHLNTNLLRGWRTQITSAGNNGTDLLYGSSLVDTREAQTFLTFGTSNDDPSGVNQDKIWQLAWDNIREWYHLQRNGLTRAFALLGKDWSLGTRSNLAGNIMFPNGFLIGNSNTPTTAVRFRGIVSSIGAISGDVAVNDIWFFTAPSQGGYIGAVCTAGGTVGDGTATIKGWGAIETTPAFRFRGVVSSIGAITGAVSVNDIWFFTSPSPGGYGAAICTTAGTAGSTAVIKGWGLIQS